MVVDSCFHFATHTFTILFPTFRNHENEIRKTQSEMHSIACMSIKAPKTQTQP